MKASGIKVHAIVGCGSIATLRRVFQSPTPFIEEVGALGTRWAARAGRDVGGACAVTVVLWRLWTVVL